MWGDYEKVPQHIWQGSIRKIVSETATWHGNFLAKDLSSCIMSVNLSDGDKGLTPTQKWECQVTIYVTSFGFPTVLRIYRRRDQVGKDYRANYLTTIPSVISQGDNVNVCIPWNLHLDWSMRYHNNIPHKNVTVSRQTYSSCLIRKFSG